MIASGGNLQRYRTNKIYVDVAMSLTVMFWEVGHQENISRYLHKPVCHSLNPQSGFLILMQSTQDRKMMSAKHRMLLYRKCFLSNDKSMK